MKADRKKLFFDPDQITSENLLQQVGQLSNIGRNPPRLNWVIR